MADLTVNITSNGTTKLCNINKPRTMDEWFATLSAYGAFGGGSLAYAYSPDGGTTFITQKDLGGTAYAATANDTVNIRLGVASHNNTVGALYAVLSGATSPNINIRVDTNQ